MTRPIRLILPLLMLLMLPSCIIYIVDFTELKDEETVPAKNQDPWGFLGDTIDEADMGTIRNAPVDTYTLPPVAWQRDASRVASVDPASLEAGTPLLSFFHTSDVQLRDERAKLFRRRGSEVIDKVIDTNLFDPDQEKYDYALYAWIVFTMNKIHGDKVSAAQVPGVSSLSVPQFMIHTGDAVHASTMQELNEFLRISNFLNVPWLNVIGNHDTSPFGTLADRPVFVATGNRISPMIQGTDIFTLMHTGPDINISDDEADKTKLLTNRYGREISIFIHQDSFADEESEHFFSTMLNEDRRVGHGLAQIPHPADNLLYTGYYAFDLKDHHHIDQAANPVISFDNEGASPGFRIIVLNTQDAFARKLTKGSLGRMTERQMEWLQNEILDAEQNGRKVLVFGHHPVTKGFAEKEQARQLERLFRRPSVLAYFTGHNHQHSIGYHKNDAGGFGFWEIITCSIIEYPNQASLVTLRRLQNGLAIDLQALSIPDNEADVSAPAFWQDARRAVDGALRDNPRGEPRDEDRNVRLLIPISF